MNQRAAKGLKMRISVCVLALVGALFVAAPSVAGAGCLNGGEMRGAVSAGQAKPLGAIMRAIGGGQIVRAELCRRSGGLVYLVDVLKGARVEHLVIDARTGQILMRR
ncbi:PepSY domain-containing protein [Breoghania sp.]|uniref:PepSY domain-containing protein n=1 Tax=Breoghania sp. TaxID=2065378 RepID=UPI002AA866D4|nr:PepSY domain-containing protein [Breoghania sp.]